ncbi:MAG: CoA transferase [Chloroflexi bacterium]|nr:MAG: CoA transferase [Chloroflexota bacterium]
MRPLDGVRVLELGNYMAGPFCGMLLGDLGADVIKVENPRGGDYARALGPFPPGVPDGAGFVRMNRNKRSVALDLKRPEARDAFVALARRADIIVENFRPGTMDDLGVGFAILSHQNPRLVYVAISGFGATGRHRDRPGLDLIVQAESGLMSITGEPDREPVKVGVPIGDLASGMYGALGALAALRQRERTGRGTFIDLALLDAAVSLAVWESGVFFTTRDVPERLGSAHRVDAPYQAFRTADGSIVVGATSPRTWQSFVELTGLDELRREEWSTPAKRRKRAGELAAIIERATRKRSTEEWYVLLSHAGIPCGRIRGYDEVFTDEALIDRGMLVDLPDPDLGSVRSLGSPLRLGDEPAVLRRAAPRLGEHTREVLREIGYDDSAIDALSAGEASPA